MWLLVLRYHIRPRQLEALPFRAGDPKMPVMCPNSRKASRVLDSCARSGAAGAPVGQQALRSGLLFLPSGPGEDLRLHEVQPLHPRSCVYKDRSVGQQVGPVQPGDGSEKPVLCWTSENSVVSLNPRTSCPILFSIYFPTSCQTYVALNSLKSPFTEGPVCSVQSPP